MCFGISGWTLRGGKVLLADDTDSHEELAQRNHLRDDGHSAAKWEYVPTAYTHRFSDFENWKLQVDGEPPAWWDESLAEAARTEALAKLRRLWNARAKAYSGSVCLPQDWNGDFDAKRIGGNLWADALTNAPVLAKVGGYLSANALTNAPVLQRKK